MRQDRPAHVYPAEDKCLYSDSVGLLLTVVMSNRKILVFNLQNPSQPYKNIQPPQKLQSLCISCFIDGTGFCIGTPEGRCYVQNIENGYGLNESFSFKCHRIEQRIYSVNAISFNPVYGTFSTAGSDSNYYIWDKDARQKTKSFSFGNTPITATQFNARGDIFAFAVGEDWSKGYQASNNYNPMVYVQYIKPEDVKPKGDAKKR